MEIMRRVNWNRTAQVVEQEVPEPAPVTPSPAPVIQTAPTPKVMDRSGSVTQTATAVQPKPKITRNRTGNGHKSEMVRKLNDSERNWLRSAFLRKNGQIEEDDCVTFKGQMISDCIAIFQITGFISYLHRDVAQGRTLVGDLQSYLNWMRDKYGALWAQYNNPRFTAMRTYNQATRRTGRPLQAIPISSVPIQPQFSTTPNFKAFPRRGAYARTGN